MPEEEFYRSVEKSRKARARLARKQKKEELARQWDSLRAYYAESAAQSYIDCIKEGRFRVINFRG